MTTSPMTAGGQQHTNIHIHRPRSEDNLPTSFKHKMGLCAGKDHNNKHGKSQSDGGRVYSQKKENENQQSQQSQMLQSNNNNNNNKRRKSKESMQNTNENNKNKQTSNDIPSVKTLLKNRHPSENDVETVALKDGGNNNNNNGKRQSIESNDSPYDSDHSTNSVVVTGLSLFCVCVCVCVRIYFWWPPFWCTDWF